MAEFIPGLQLSEIFYQEVVKPILEECFPNLTYSAALMGTGSEVLGFDTPQSMDHHWGPKLQLFVREEESVDPAIVEVVKERRLEKIFTEGLKDVKLDESTIRMLARLRG